MADETDLSEAKRPNRRRLWQIVAGAGLIGVATGAAFWNQMGGTSDLGWVGWLIIIMLALITYSISFYFGHRYLEDSLDQYIVSDTFKRKHDWIDLETETRESGDARIDGWVAHYKFIRTLFAMGLLPLIACIYIFWFA
jgi:hypothetical protein